MKYILVLLFAYFCFTQTATPICTKDSDCNNFETQNKLYCDTTKTPAVCTTRPSVEYKTTSALNFRGSCSSGLNFGSESTQICGSYNTGSCPVALANVLYFRCINSVYSFTQSACVAQNSTAITYVGLNQRCNSTLPCLTNLQCIQSVCRPTLTVGSNCISGGVSCGTGLICNGDSCVVPHQKSAGQPCFVAQECLSSVCTNGRCQERSKQACYSNSECGIGFASVCGGSNGTCTIGAQFTQSAHSSCVANTCTTSITPSTSTLCGCESQFVANLCAAQCLERVDNRLVNDGFIYDCTALKRSQPAANTCEIKATVTNCPTSSGAIQKLSLFMIMIILFFL